MVSAWWLLIAVFVGMLIGVTMMSLAIMGDDKKDE